jgi:PAS domain S-box-containing protein
MMKDEKKTKKQLITELIELRRSNATLEKKLGRTEMLWRENKDVAQALIEAPTDSVFFIDSKGIILAVNETAAKRLGKRAEDLIGLCGYDLVSSDVAKSRKPIMNQVFRSGKLHRFEDKRAGLWYDTVIYPFRDGSEKVTKVAVIARDITARKKAEKALLKSKEFSDALIDSMHDGFSVLDNKGVHINVNTTLCKMTGFSKEELVGVGPPHPYWSPEDYESIGKAFHKTLQGEFDDFELTFMRKNGERFPVIVSPSSVKDRHGNIISYFATVKDITERKRVEEKILLANERLNYLLSSTNAIIYAAKTSGDYEATFISENVKQITGYEPQQFISENSFWFKHIHPEDQPKVEEEVSKLFEKNFHHYEYRFQRYDGTYLWFRDEMKLMRDEKGNPLEIIGFWEDIDERKKLEEQLLQAQKMESVGQLAGGIAHDFNNILTAIIGYGNLLKKCDSAECMESYITRLLSSAERAVSLTQALLAFGRKQIISPKPVNLFETVQGVKNLLSRIIGEDIELSTFFKNKDLTVIADRSQIEQILMNLATNARDAMADGGKLSIQTDLVRFDDDIIKAQGYGKPGLYALISVEDTGQGMDQETKERLFEPFFTTKEVGQGTGLGLSMAYGIIKQHNGYIDVLSAPGEGTTFKIYLPLTHVKVEDKRTEALPIVKRGTETILIAEDDTYVRDFIKEILTGYGYKIIEAFDGEDAIKVFNRHRDAIHLLILDVIMPKKDGKKVYQEIKKICLDTKVIFISGYATDILYKKGMLEEGLNFISKPLSPNELLIKVQEVLDS